MNTRDTLKVNSAGHLEIGGADCVELAREFGTPLYVFDEAYIRSMMRLYRDTIAEEYGGNGLVLYASKAFSCKAMYAIAKQERIGVDVVSGGELYTALSAGFPAEKIYLHGNNKLPKERAEALDAGIGGIVVDAYSEADALDEEAAARNADGDARQQVRVLRRGRCGAGDDPPRSCQKASPSPRVPLPHRFADL